MKKASIGFSTIGKILGLAVATIIFLLICFQLLLLALTFFGGADMADSPYYVMVNNPALLIFFLIFRGFWLYAVFYTAYLCGLTISVYDDHIEYKWFKKVIRKIDLQDVEVHVYKSLFKNLVAIYDKKTNKFHQVYAKQKTKEFVDYATSQNLVITHDNVRYYRNYMKTNHPGAKKGL